MPPKVKVAKQDIVQTALDLIRRDGETALNARSIAAALGCSTQPVFTNFATMEELQQAALTAAYDCYLSFLKSEAQRGKYPAYKAYGMAYIRFAREEKELFKLLFMRNRKGEGRTPTADFEESVDYIVNANGIPRDRAELMHLEMWSCVHGVATMLATSFIPLEEDLISTMLTDVYQGLRVKHTEENKGQ
jgi:AcrR family transcriptional regulator